MKKHAVCIAVSACACCVMSAQVEIVYTFAGKRIEKKALTIEPDAANVVRVHIPQAELPPGLDTVTVLPDFAAAQTGEEGRKVSQENTHLLETDKMNCIEGSLKVVRFPSERRNS